MLGPDVRTCYEEGTGFITAVGIHHDRTGRARERMLAIAGGIGGLRQGAIELTPMQEAVLDLAVEQVLSPALTHVNTAFVQVMSEQGIPFEAIMTELVLSGEVERTYGRLREEGFARQMEHHSPTSQYGQLSRRGRYDELDVVEIMRRLTDDITSGRFADEWDAERDAGHPRLAALKEQHCGPFVQELEDDLRARLGPRPTPPDRHGSKPVLDGRRATQLTRSPSRTVPRRFWRAVAPPSSRVRHPEPFGAGSVTGLQR